MKIDKLFTAIGKKITTCFLLFLLPLGVFGAEKIVFGLTGTVYKGDLQTFREWESLLEKQLNVDVEIKFSRTYAEMMSMVEHGQVDMAYVCNSTYIKLEHDNLAKVLAMPVSDGKMVYYSMILSQKDKDYESLLDFRDKRFAFTDPNSNSGAIAPTYELLKRGNSPKKYFKHLVYTYEHAESIQAVLDGFVDGASVDSLVYEQFIKRFPKRAKNLKVVEKLGPFTMSPIVAGSHIKPSMFDSIQQALVSMHKDKKGQEIFKALSLDRLNLPEEEKFDDIRKMMDFIEQHR